MFHGAPRFSCRSIALLSRACCVFVLGGLIGCCLGLGDCCSSRFRMLVIFLVSLILSVVSHSTHLSLALFHYRTKKEKSRIDWTDRGNRWQRWTDTYRCPHGRALTRTWQPTRNIPLCVVVAWPMSNSGQSSGELHTSWQYPTIGEYRWNLGDDCGVSPCIDDSYASCVQLYNV